MNIYIEFTEEQMKEINALQEQEGFDTVQDAIINAVRLCLKD
jgi:hypothetical protein